MCQLTVSLSFLEVVVSHEEMGRGMLILPEEQFVAMQDTPVTSRIMFSQFSTTLSGSVTCVGTCVRTYFVYTFQ